MTEDVTLYCPGGYHPIIVGEAGSCVTAWLVHKTDDSAEVFFAVILSKVDGIPTSEVAMLQTAAKFHRHSLSVSILLGHFPLRGPNGTHSVLATGHRPFILFTMRISITSTWPYTSCSELVICMNSSRRCAVYS